MAAPSVFLKIAFTITATGFGLLLGAFLAATVFTSNESHGFGGIVNMFKGAGIGLGVGLAVAVLLLFKFNLSSYALRAASLAFTAGALLVFLFIQILDYYEKW